MGAINNRLRQLEDIETRLYLVKEAAIHRRAGEDEQLQFKRQEEDREFLEALRERDQEEDELRRRRRVLSRLSFDPLAAESHNESEASAHVDTGPMTRSKTNVKDSVDKIIPCFSSTRKDYGLPIACDSQGRNLFSRPSDGKMVYLHCCIPGCGRTSFPNVMALRNHVSAPAGLHKSKGLLTSNAQAIEMCGQSLVNGMPLTTARDQPFGAGAAQIPKMQRGAMLPSPPTSSTEPHQGQENFRVISNAEARSGATLSKLVEPFRTQDSSRADMASMNRSSPTRPRTRAQEAAEIFDGFMSSDSEDSDESEDSSSQGSEMRADRASQNTYARGATKPWMSLRIDGYDPASVVLAVDDQAIKEEPGTSLSPSLGHAEVSADPKAFVIPFEVEHAPKFETEVQYMMPTTIGRPMAPTATRKRAISAPAATPRIVSKRPRLTGEKFDPLRSCSRVATE